MQVNSGSDVVINAFVQHLAYLYVSVTALHASNKRWASHSPFPERMSGMVLADTEASSCYRGSVSTTAVMVDAGSFQTGPPDVGRPSVNPFPLKLFTSGILWDGSE